MNNVERSYNSRLACVYQPLAFSQIGLFVFCLSMNIEHTTILIWAVWYILDFFLLLRQFWTIWYQLVPFETIWDHLGPFGTIRDHWISWEYCWAFKFFWNLLGPLFKIQCPSFIIHNAIFIIHYPISVSYIRSLIFFT